jgi:hypothetical protein
MRRVESDPSAGMASRLALSAANTTVSPHRFRTFAISASSGAIWLGSQGR